MAGIHPSQRLRAAWPLTRVDDYPLSDELLEQLDALIDRQLYRIAAGSENTDPHRESQEQSET